MPSAYSVRAVRPGGLRLLGRDVGPQVHARAVEPAEERLAGLGLALDEVDRRASEVSSSIVSIRFLVSGPVSSIVCLPTGPSAAARSGRPVGGLAAEHAARAELLLELRVARVGALLRLLLGVEVVEVAEELVEAVDGRQVLVAVAEVVLAELAGGVAERLEQLGDGRCRSFCSPTGAPGTPTLLSPVRSVHWPVMNDDRPAVQLCSA